MTIPAGETVGTVGAVLGVFPEKSAWGPSSEPSFFSDTPRSDPTVPTVSPAGIVTVQAQWEQAIQLAAAGFERAGTSYSELGLHGAAWLEASVAFGWELPVGIDTELVAEWLEAIYAGRAVGRLSASGRPIVSIVSPNKEVS